jgi:hypothetical protein
MKKILLSLMLIGSFLFGKSQVVLNEIYGNPGGANSEFIELYNSAVGDQNVGCFTILTYYEIGSKKGWYVLDLPNVKVDPKSWFVLAPQTPFSVQGTAGATADVNWNDLAFRNGSTGGGLKQYELNATGTDYTDVTPANNVAITNISDGALNGEQTYITLLFQEGALINGFIGGGASGDLPTAIDNLPDLNNIPIIGSCSLSSFNVDFSALPIMEFWNPSGGNDNGYARTSDGKCGSWIKTAKSGDHTPGITNGSAAGLAGSLLTAQLIKACGNLPGETQAVVEFDITGVSGSVTEADDLPVTIFVYNDVNRNGGLDGTDTVIRFKDQETIAEPADTVKYSPRGIDLILVYKTKRGCFDKVVSLRTECISLPVKFKSFNASRTAASNVSITWTTASEQNSKGFNVQKNVNGEWQTIAFVPSQALGGNSSYDINYSFKDANNEKGITQYRVQQVDLDGKFAYTDIRAIRGEGTVGKIIVYPNPSVDGKVNVVFEDNTVRDIQVNDMQGKIIKSYRGITNNILVIERLTSGFYTIKITNRNTAASSVEKVVVK